MVIVEQWGGVCIGSRVQASAQAETGRLVATLGRIALVTGPSKIRHRAGRGDAKAVDFFPRVPTNIADPDLAGPWPGGDAEWVTEPVCNDSARVRVAVPEQRIIG